MELDHGAILRKEIGHTTAYNGFKVAIANAVVNCGKYGIASVLEGLAGQGLFFECFRPSLLFGVQVGLLYRETCLGPAAPAAIHRNDVGVAHLLQVVGDQGRPESASAVEHERRIFIGEGLLDIAFDDALAEMHGPGQMAARPFACLPARRRASVFRGRPGAA